MILRRDFITLLGGAAAWPVLARAQQRERVRRIGVLMPLDENDPFGKTEFSAFIQALGGLGWADGRNVRMDLRWFGDDINLRPLTPMGNHRQPPPEPGCGSRGMQAHHARCL